jgi:hypothetical protein
MGRREELLGAAWIAAFLLALGALGTWVSAPGSSVSGVDGAHDGWIVAAVAVAAGALVFRVRGRRECALVMLAASVLSLGVSAYDRTHLDRVVGSTPVGPLVRAGWGLNLDLLASGALGVVGLLWLLQWRAEGEVAAPAHPVPK